VITPYAAQAAEIRRLLGARRIADAVGAARSTGSRAASAMR